MMRGVTKVLSKETIVRALITIMSAVLKLEGTNNKSE
jgi:hypothetical protein